jgi:hypothetical protein
MENRVLNGEIQSEKINRLNILVNQVGYLTHGRKRFVVESNICLLQPDFSLRDTVSGASPYEGKLEKVDGDFGRYWVGDFTGLCVPGTYVIDVRLEQETKLLKALDRGWRSSEIIAIQDEVYQPLLTRGMECFAQQRCGPSMTGYHAPCHLDDGVRSDNGQFLDVVGGWHDASDLCKPAYTIIGLLGLLEMAENSPGQKMKARIYEEVKWGNLYFLKLQDSEGYFRGIGVVGDQPQEGNHWTDNVRGTADDRQICINVGLPYQQHMFIIGQAHLAHLYRDWDAHYAQTCLAAARRCFNWQKGEDARSASAPNALSPDRYRPSGYKGYVPPPQPSECLECGTGAGAGMALFKVTQERDCLDYAIAMADRFIQLQHSEVDAGQPRGYFSDERGGKCGMRNNAGYYGIIGFCSFIEGMKALKQDTGRWEKSLAMYCEEYLAVMSRRNAFGIVPERVKLDSDNLPGSRNFNGLSYRYFKSPLAGIAQGNNSTLSATGIILSKAARILGNDQYRGMAQSMLDWILGVNPFEVSLVNGVGYKSPPEYVYSGFNPRTPRIPGSVILGICGDPMDRPELRIGCWDSSEICIPPTILTMWLANELMRE